MSGMDPKLLQASLDAVAGRERELAEFFYARLFLLAVNRDQPEVQAMFPLVMTAQRDRLLGALVQVVQLAASGDTAALTALLEDTGRSHRMIAALRPEHFPLVGEALLATLAEYAGKAWTAEVAATWNEAYALVSSVMVKAMEDDGSPRWWDATVISSRMLSRDVLGLLVHLGQPMAWEPGQSVKAEIDGPPAPSVRRWLTPVNAPPGAGDRLEFHVRVIPWGVFGPALARAARQGAALRLSAPGGTLRLDGESSRPVLMIAGSTGLSPMLAMLEALARRPDPPATSLYFGARDPEGLYAAPELDGMTASRPWLSVTYAVEAPAGSTPGYQGAHGTVTSAAMRDGRDWSGHDVYACGPPTMVRAALDRLARAGVPPGQVHAEEFLS